MSSKAALLCVDDEKYILSSLKGQLKEHFGSQFVIETAESATEAWEVIDELMQGDTRIVLIVTDWLMPRIKGDTFLIQLHNKFPGIIKIMLTGQANRESVDRARNEGGLFRCLNKPWDENELFETIEAGLNRL